MNIYNPYQCTCNIAEHTQASSACLVVAPTCKHSTTFWLRLAHSVSVCVCVCLYVWPTRTKLSSHSIASYYTFYHLDSNRYQTVLVVLLPSCCWDTLPGNHSSVHLTKLPFAKHLSQFDMPPFSLPFRVYLYLRIKEYVLYV